MLICKYNCFILSKINTYEKNNSSYLLYRAIFREIHFIIRCLLSAAYVIILTMKDETILTFTGDIGFDKYMDRKWEDENLLDSDVLNFLKTTDHLVINVEGPLTQIDPNAAKDGAMSLKHGMNPEAALFFDSIGADIWNICNNHICDCGPKGIEDTIHKAISQGVKTLGAGMDINEASTPVILPEAGGIGMIGVGYQRACRKADDSTPGCFSWSDIDLISKRINEIKSKARWCIVVAHAGEEFTALPSPYTRQRYIDYLNLGADMVIAHHPHVPMNYEIVDGKPVFYSLGNFIFDTDYQRSQFNTQYGIFLKIKFTKDNFEFVPFGIEIDRVNERIIKGDIPKIFVDVQKEEYDKLIPLASKMFIENTKRQLKYLRPKDFENATEEDFVKNFYEPLRSGRVPGECLDMQIIYPLSLKADEGKWKDSKLETVKEFILEQL